MATLRDQLEAGLGHHKAGRLAKAEAAYRAVLGAAPEHADALHLLGLVALQSGRVREAAKLVERAIEARPDVAGYHNTMGEACRRLGRSAEAETRFRKALALDPGHAKAHGNLAGVLLGRKATEEAEALYREALRLDPGSLGDRIGLGNALRAAGRLVEAESEHRSAVKARDGSAAAHLALANTLFEAGRMKAAAEAYGTANARDPRLTQPLIGLGRAAAALGQTGKAALWYRAALKLDPKSAEVTTLLADALDAGGDKPAALTAYDDALTVKPGYLPALVNASNVLKALGRTSEALARCEAAVAAAPNFAPAHNNLGGLLKDIGRIAEAIEHFRKAAALDPGFAAAESNAVMALQYLEDPDPAEVLAAHRRWAERHAGAPDDTGHANDRDPGRRLHVGYVSPDFRAHSVAAFIEPVIAAHDRDRVEVFAYANLLKPDAVTDRIEAAADGFRPIREIGAEAAAAAIRADGIDVLVDLAGHTANHALGVFAHAPAPVQMTWLGYPGTTGLGTVGYRLTDAIADPPAAGADEYTETLVRLPGCFLAYRPPEAAPDVADPAAERNGFVTFGSFNNLAKTNDAVVATWARILTAVEGARLVLKAPPLADEGIRNWIVERFAGHGLAPDRLELLGFADDPAEHLGRYGAIDVALDTFPYNGATTTCEALWMGVPVVTFPGDRHAARVGASLLSAAGLDELVATDRDDYVGRAVALAGDPGCRRDLRATLRGRLAQAPLTDAGRLARTLEDAYREAWTAWCAEAS